MGRPQQLRWVGRALCPCDVAGVASTFWSRVERGLGCWGWIGARDRDGYGLLSHAGRFLRAHRVSLALAGQSIPAGAIVMHHCDNPSCVRPDHLSVGTNRDNVGAAVSHNRNCFGERSCKAKLTDAQVREIRRRRAEGCRRLAQAFGVSESTTSRILNFKKWKQLHEEDTCQEETVREGKDMASSVR